MDLSIALPASDNRRDGISRAHHLEAQAPLAISRSNIMTPRLTPIIPFTISGLSTRTSNRDEGDPSTARLPLLWGRFFGEDVQSSTPEQVPGTSVYGVYSEYESDASGAYTVTVGVSVTTPAIGLSSATVLGGHYLVFDGHGEMPQVVIDLWKSVWGYFESHREHTRAFQTDFERYAGPRDVSIYISISDPRP
jgi:predicted transcriptional regulator YdeE